MNQTPADYAIVFVDVLGFSEIVTQSDWAQISALYETLHTLVGDFWRPRPPADPNHTGSLLFSDCALMWTRYTPQAADGLLALAAEFYCDCLRAGILLRGAAATGEMIIDAGAGVVVGPPLVEAARAEQCQKWSGIALCNSFFREPGAVRRDLHTSYDRHKKSAVESHHTHLLSEFVLDWRETWRRTSPEAGSAIEFIAATFASPPHEHLRITLEFLAI